MEENISLSDGIKNLRRLQPIYAGLLAFDPAQPEWENEFGEIVQAGYGRVPVVGDSVDVPVLEMTYVRGVGVFDTEKPHTGHLLMWIEFPGGLAVMASGTSVRMDLE